MIDIPKGFAVLVGGSSSVNMPHSTAVPSSVDVQLVSVSPVLRPSRVPDATLEYPEHVAAVVPLRSHSKTAVLFTNKSHMSARVTKIGA